MNRRFLMLAATVILFLITCTSTGIDDARGRPFVSDRVSVVTRGSGPDIILIPGLTGHRDQWAGVAADLDDRYRLHLVQVKGFAGTAPEATMVRFRRPSPQNSRATSPRRGSSGPQLSATPWVGRSV